MTRVDFYILQDVELTALQRFACRLTVRALDKGHRVYLHTDDDVAAAEIDALLWSNPAHRFIPHCLQADTAAAQAPVLVGWDEPLDHDQVLINLSRRVPSFFGRFDRVAEIVVGETRDTGRDRYRFYRDRGFPLFDHNMDEWEGR